MSVLPDVLGMLAEHHPGTYEDVKQQTEEYLDPLQSNVRFVLIEHARKTEGSDTVEFDDEAATSEGNDGTWVLGWVLIRPEHAGVSCAVCDELIEDEEDGTSSPQGSMHVSCAAEHQADHPEEW